MVLKFIIFLVGKEKSRLIIEFCLENVRKVMVLKEREERSNNFKAFKKQQSESSIEEKSVKIEKIDGDDNKKEKIE